MERDQDSDASEELSDISEEIEESDTEENILNPYRFEPHKSEEEEYESSEETSDDSDEDIGRLQNTEWCSCSNCSPMPLIVECRCCQEIPQVVQEIQRDARDVKCVTELQSFAVCCLNTDVLRVAHFAYIDHHGDHAQAAQHEKYRYIAYRQFVRLCWGHLGKDVRVPLPSCVINKIRNTFPSVDYVGFRYPQLE